MPRSKKEQPQYHHGDLKLALIKEARRHIDADGWANLNLRDLARQVGVSHMAPYRHFKDKYELLAEVATQGFVTLIAEMQQSINQNLPTLLEATTSLFRTYVKFGRSHPLLFSLMFSPELANRAQFPSLDKAAKESGDILLRFIESWQEKGNIRAGDPQLFRVAALSFAHGTAVLLSAGHLSRKEVASLGIEAMIDANSELLVRGLTQ